MDHLSMRSRHIGPSPAARALLGYRRLVGDMIRNRYGEIEHLDAIVSATIGMTANLFMYDGEFMYGLGAETGLLDPVTAKPMIECLQHLIKNAQQEGVDDDD